MGADRVLAVLDWELSTLGDPMADLAYNCMPFHLPAVSAVVHWQINVVIASWSCMLRALRVVAHQLPSSAPSPAGCP
jgi:aminoglycoside phosphotransferase (APT) family kinase protein